MQVDLTALKKLVFTADPQTSLRMSRHLAALVAIMLLTLASIYFSYRGMLKTGDIGLLDINLMFWAGLLLITFAIRSGISRNFPDPSMTMTQMIWCSLYILVLIYLLNEWRSIALMPFFAILSFGYFRLDFREFLAVTVFIVIGYLVVIFYIELNDADRIELDRELIQLLGFALTCMVMVYTGSAVSKLRVGFKERNEQLADALKLNTRLATTDDLTGLYTRRYLMNMLSNQKALSEREDTDFVILFADLDHFKHINDSFGHYIGDTVLKNFADIIRTSIREIDYGSRFGGEEFVVLLVNTDIEQSKAVAERIRSGIENYNFNDIAPGLHVTVSIGMANYKQYKSIQETLMTADNRMYKAKDQGRNKIVFE
ncbi:MAG: GGDEF domain-containing protein [Thiotrichales bacterium]|nr:MAG: GGDEF domain-containing protein [Thiotrichales bacterium]